MPEVVGAKFVEGPVGRAGWNKVSAELLGEEWLRQWYFVCDFFQPELDEALREVLRLSKQVRYQVTVGSRKR